MPTRVVNGAQIHYEETGSGPETIVFSHGLLMSGEMFSRAGQGAEPALPLHQLRSPRSGPQ